ncbi:hypothetical protein T484DRAFT_1773775 [Baffinella frigidus]|nr:hypothetical protein T484DRAFT_1773775 [Cryptophyta sp. CCMP2293]
MKEIIETENLQIVACQALASISGPSELKAAIATSGAVPAVIEAMKTYPANPKLQEQGFFFCFFFFFFFCINLLNEQGRWQGCFFFDFFFTTLEAT